MPLDGTGPDLSGFSLSGLAHILRNGNDEREFYFPDCSRCAMGTARARWGQHMTPEEMTGGDSNAARRIFYDGGGRSIDVTAEIVAGRIDDFLAGRPIRVFVEGDRELVDA